MREWERRGGDRERDFCAISERKAERQRERGDVYLFIYGDVEIGMYAPTRDGVVGDAVPSYFVAFSAPPSAVPLSIFILIRITEK